MTEPIVVNDVVNVIEQPDLGTGHVIVLNEVGGDTWATVVWDDGRGKDVFRVSELSRVDVKKFERYVRHNT